MNPSINIFNNSFAMRGITSREQLLNEMLRVKLTARAAESMQQTADSGEQLFRLMKKSTENTILGYFPGDRDFFLTVYKIAQEIDLIEYAVNLYQNYRFGHMHIFSPAYLTEYISGLIDDSRAQSILITEAEKNLSGLKDLVEKHQMSSITLTTSNERMHKLLKLAFEKYSNVSIVQQSIYQQLPADARFDFIYSLPDFVGRVKPAEENYFSSRPDVVAVKNLVGHLSEGGRLVAVIPARLTFAGGSEARLRSYITANYQLEAVCALPETTFKPHAAIKTYMLTISTVKKDNVTVGSFDCDNGTLYLSRQKTVPSADLAAHNDWRIDLLLLDNDEYIKRYKASNVRRVKLYEVAEVFRGKSVLKKDIKPGKILVLNISNITDAGIDYAGMDSIDEDERKIKRYELADGDIVLSCRGSAIKTAVFRRQKNTVIASANVMVIRPNNRVLSDYLKIFLESPVGMALIKSFQRGTVVVNINHSDIREMEIPLLSIEEQQELVARYQAESSLYQKTISEAEKRFAAEKEKIYQRLF